MIMVVRMNHACESSALTLKSANSISIVSLLFTHGIAPAMQAIAECRDDAARLDAALQIAHVLRSGRFINDDPDKPVALAAPDWQVQLEQIYYLWVDVMDGKVLDSKPTMSVASHIVRSGFAAVFLRALVDNNNSAVPLSAENLYDTYASAANDVNGSDARFKPFSKLGPSVRRAWLAVATAIARLNGQHDPSPGAVSVPDVVTALGLVTERFGPPKQVAT